MGLYKVMIIDDEEEVREAIQQTLPWEELGFEVAETAENGEDALEKSETVMPDVVLTDIQMPFMDGLTFCRKLKEKLANVKIIIFSGYDEFEYAKEAIKLEAEEYLLKPVDKEEVKKVFLRLKSVLDEEMDQKKNLAKLQKYYEESAPLLQEQFLMGILFHRLSETEFTEYSGLYGSLQEEGTYAVMVLNAIHPPTDEENSMTQRLLPLSIKTIAAEDLEKNFVCHMVNYLGTVIVIVQMSEHNSIHEVLLSAQRICNEGKRVLGINLCAGVGRSYSRISRLHISYEEAKTAQEYSTFLGKNQVIYIEDVENGERETDLVDERRMDDIIHEIKVGSEEKLREVIQSLFQEISAMNSPLLQMRLSCTEVIVRLVRLCKMYQLKGDLVTRMEEVLNGAARGTSLAAVREQLETLCLELQERIREEQKGSSRILAEKAVEYIRRNYQDSSCSVEKVCHYIGVSAAYFALIFKKELGTSFLSYLTKVRMEQAVALLTTTQEKAYMIAGMVGYDEPNYFSYAFKKYYGVSPIRYRAGKTKNESH